MGEQTKCPDCGRERRVAMPTSDWFNIFAVQVVAYSFFMLQSIQRHNVECAALDLAFALLSVLLMMVVCMDEDEGTGKEPT